MKAQAFRAVAIAATAVAVAALAGSARNAAAALPPGNTVAQWNKIAEDTVVGSGAFQAEGFIYMAYASTAVYDAVVAIEVASPLDSTIKHRACRPRLSERPRAARAASRALRSIGRLRGGRGRLPDASLLFSALPALIATLDADHAEALSNLGGCAADGGAGTAVGLRPRTRSSSTARPDRTRMGA